MTNEELAMLKAEFSAAFVEGADVVYTGGCDTCGYGADEAMDLQAIYQVLDEFFDPNLRAARIQKQEQEEAARKEKYEKLFAENNAIRKEMDELIARKKAERAERLGK